MKSQTRRLNLIGYLSAAMLLFAGVTAVRAEEIPEPRVSTTSQGQGIQRGTIGDGVTSHDELKPLIITGSRDKSTRAGAQQAPSASGSYTGARTPNVEFWIYNASVELFSDLDRDGYYYGIDLTFDADTVYSEADVYVVVYLSYNFGPWNEYTSTDDFIIFGASGADSYSIETELVSGYQTGDYDILIELFDNYDGSFVASFGPEDSSELSYLPLEDAGRDAPPTATTVIINEGGGGSLGLIVLLALFGVAVLAKSRKAIA
jgi:hypothetical protein